MARPKLSPTEEAKRDFIRGAVDVWSPGGYGATVHIWAEGGALKIRWTKPKRRQKTYFREDTRDHRRELAEIACTLVAKIGGNGNERRRVRREQITVRGVWLAYFRDRWPDIPDRAIRGGRREIREYYAWIATLPEDARRQVPSARTLLSATQCMRRITQHPSYRGDRPIDALQPADWSKYALWRLTQTVPRGDGHYGAGTVETDYRKFHAAIRHCMEKRPQWWAGRRDPLAGTKAVDAATKPVPELGEETARLMLADLKQHLRRRWSAYASLAIGMETARRISEIGPDTLGFGSDTLRASDFHRDQNGRLLVTFRAATLKGRSFGRGDITIPATRALEVVFRWLTRFHPNPRGPDAPLIWTKDNPSRSVSYTTVRGHFITAWRNVHDGKDPPRGLKFHAVCRTVITTLADEIGLEKTAEFVGRSMQTVERIYKRVRPETQAETADTLDRLRGRPRRMAQGG